MPRANQSPTVSSDKLLASALLPKLEHRPLASLRRDGRKARTHSPQQIRSVAKSIRQFGFINPIIVDEQGRVLAGHARVAAAEQLAVDTVPVVVASHLTEADKRAYVIADNRLAELAGWDKSILAEEFKDLIELGFDVELTGFAELEVEAIVFGEQALDADVGEGLPVAAAPVSRLGDLWELGPHRLLCADATKPDSYTQLLEGERARAVFTDPPYNCPIQGHVTSNVAHRDFPMGVGEMSDAEFTAFLSSFLSAASSVCLDGALIISAMDWRNALNILSAGLSARLSLLNTCVWVKDTCGMGSLYRSQHEFFFVFKSGDGVHLNNVELGRHGRNRSNVWSYPGFNGFRAEGRSELQAHPTPKPVALVKDALLDCTRKGDIVLDPFSGGGSTLLACEHITRRARAMELDPGYIDAALLRWEAFCGGIARHRQTGMTYGELKRARAEEALRPALPMARPRVRAPLVQA